MPVQIRSSFQKKPFYSGNNAADVLGLVNYYRETVGLDTVVLSETLSNDCYAHATYMQKNGTFAHTQSGSYFTSPNGAHAGLNSVLAQNVAGMYQSVDVWMESLYHRIPILEPGLRENRLCLGWKERLKDTVTP